MKTLENLMARKDNTLESMNELSVTNEVDIFSTCCLFIVFDISFTTGFVLWSH